jgi:hypothetical protein
VPNSVAAPALTKIILLHSATTEYSFEKLNFHLKDPCAISVFIMSQKLQLLKVLEDKSLGLHAETT